MKSSLLFLVAVLGIAHAQALIISEVMSNPTGDDSGREWIEIYNDTNADADLSAMTISIKGGSFVTTTPLQGGTTIPPSGYAIVGSTVSGATKFLQDYPSYSGPLFRASISLVNTGVTSIDIKLNGTLAASLPSYTAAKEGSTLSYVSGSYGSGTPTPGAENKAEETSSSGSSSATSTDTQVTLPQMTPPSPDIVIYLLEEKVVVAGAETEFSAFALTRAGKEIANLRYAWTFGDGGQGTGSTTKYKYVYNGRYVAFVEASNNSVLGTGRMVVRVVPPDIAITKTGSGKYGTYIDVTNPNSYDLDVSQWMFSLDGAAFPFPRHTVLPARETVRFSGLAMGFASTTIAASSSVKILFPNLEEVAKFIPSEPEQLRAYATQTPVTPAAKIAVKAQPKVLGVQTPPKPQVASSTKPVSKKDTRIASWIKSFFK